MYVTCSGGNDSDNEVKPRTSVNKNVQYRVSPLNEANLGRFVTVLPALGLNNAQIAS